MATDLKKQLAKLRESHLPTAALTSGRPSLFLTAREAAAVDISTIYDAAIQSLATLMQYDQRLESFQETLLHPSSVNVQRELKTKEVKISFSDSLYMSLT